MCGLNNINEWIVEISADRSCIQSPGVSGVQRIVAAIGDVSVKLDFKCGWIRIEFKQKISGIIIF